MILKINEMLRDAAKKELFFLVAGPLRGRGGGGKGLATKKKEVFLKLLAKSLFFDKFDSIWQKIWLF